MNDRSLMPPVSVTSHARKWLPVVPAALVPDALVPLGALGPAALVPLGGLVAGVELPHAATPNASAATALNAFADRRTRVPWMSRIAT